MKRATVTRLATKIRLNLEWAGCYSWTEYLIGPFGNGITAPRVEDVLREIVLHGLNKRGLQVHFEDRTKIDPSTNGIPGLGLVKNFRKIWDVDTPVDEVHDKFNMTESELRVHLLAELKNFSEQYVTELAELGKRVDELQERARKKDIELDITKILPDSEMPIKEHASTTELQHQCEEAREKLRSIKDLEIFLPFVHGALDFGSVKDPTGIASRILCFPRRGSSEDQIRSFMRKLNLPENEFVIFDTHGFRDVIHETSEDIRNEIAVQNALWDQAHKLELKLRKLLPFNRRLFSTSISMEHTGEIQLTDRSERPIPKFGRDFRLYVHYECPMGVLRRQRNRIKKSGWDIDRYQWRPGYRQIRKFIRLSLDDTIDSAKGKLTLEIAPFRLKPQNS